MAIAAQKYIGDSDGFQNYNVVKKDSLNYLDAGENSNKYYTIELHEANGKYRIFTDFGRLCKSSTKQVRYASTIMQAESEYERLLRAKCRKGYKKVELAQSTTGSNKGKQLIDTTQIKAKKSNNKATKSKLKPAVQEFIKQIYDEAERKLNHLVSGTANSDGASPLGKLSVNQINKGRIILQDIANVIDSKKIVTVNDVLRLSSDYYGHIPKSFGHKINPNDVAITTQSRISEELDILKFYEDALRMGSVMFDMDDIDKKYESLKCDIGVLDKRSKKYKELVHYVNSTESRHHSVHLKVKRIFTVNQHNAPRFDDRVGNVKELFHGSRSCNLVGILSSYLRLPNTLKGVHITGAMFGPGIYFADQSTKSSQYSCSRFGGSSNKYPTAFMFVAGVALGNVKKVNRSHYYMKPPAGYHSVKGVEGPSLLHNEFITYKENQQELRYIIEIEPVSRY